ncbi:MAG: hypothetical protein AAF628_10230 [Planctomycetota bacterium]
MKVLRGQGDADAEGLTVDDGVLLRFLDEAKVTGQLDYPGIVPLHDPGVDSAERVHFTVPLIRGRLPAWRGSRLEVSPKRDRRQTRAARVLELGPPLRAVAATYGLAARSWTIPSARAETAPRWVRKART